MEHTLTCNDLKCRTELRERALVTTCSHIFCLECAHRSGMAGQDGPRRSTCPACNSQLNNPDDAVITSLCPSEEYKTSVLSGLSPNVIMECAGRALSFWAYQATQDIYYQQYLYKNLTDKYSSLSVRLDRTVNDANSEIDNLQHSLTALSSEQDTLRRRYEDLSQSHREKTRKLLQTQELYDKVKRKAEMGHIQRAASDAVDSSILSAAQGASQVLGGLLTDEQPNGPDSMGPPFGQSHRFDLATGMNTAAPRSAHHQHSEDNRWPRLGGMSRPDMTGMPMAGGSLRRRMGANAFDGASLHSGLASTPAPMTGSNRSASVLAPPTFAHSRGGLAGVGLTSGLKVSQPMPHSGLDAPTRTL